MSLGNRTMERVLKHDRFENVSKKKIIRKNKESSKIIQRFLSYSV